MTPLLDTFINGSTRIRVAALLVVAMWGCFVAAVILFIATALAAFGIVSVDAGQTLTGAMIAFVGAIMCTGIGLSILSE